MLAVSKSRRLWLRNVTSASLSKYVAKGQKRK